MSLWCGLTCIERLTVGGLVQPSTGRRFSGRTQVPTAYRFRPAAGVELLKKAAETAALG